MPRVVHVGLGAFHRAHQAVYTEDAGWEVCAVAPRSAEVVRALRERGHRYTLLVRDGERATARTISSIRATLHAPTERDRVVAVLADPETTVVTLTVTEKAYRPGGAVVALLAEGLAARARKDAGPLAVVSCDNVPGNGRRLRELFQEYAGIGAEVTFPGTVVDRIVPAATREDRELTGDPAVVVAEPYTHWVLEDGFPAARPEWERGGALFTADVTPHEQAKIRILNGTHSTLAYTGALIGHEHIATALADPALEALAHRLTAEDVLPSLTPPDGLDLAVYTAAILARMRNTALRHRCAQVAIDGSLKVPIRLLGTVRDRLAAGAHPRWACLAVAAWLRHVRGGVDDRGRPLEVSDPLADRLRSLPPEEALRVPEVFGADLPDEPAFTGQVLADLRDLARHGAAAVIRRETTT
ncbi:mannitol dehydrogenase family protein [Nonomuraea sp. NPDC049607]|uniref:mannitol dehydrogenase family protein n=1 Tax=Nonomuraea sp. NPDC049607 TaxID=3154732 RepID=UPI00342F8597